MHSVIESCALRDRAEFVSKREHTRLIDKSAHILTNKPTKGNTYAYRMVQRPRLCCTRRVDTFSSKRSEWTFLMCEKALSIYAGMLLLFL